MLLLKIFTSRNLTSNDETVAYLHFSIAFLLPNFLSECVNFTLVCTIDENCNKTCPNYTTRCEGTCDNPVLIVEFDVEGVDPKCRPNDTCTPDGCTSK